MLQCIVLGMGNARKQYSYQRLNVACQYTLSHYHQCFHRLFLIGRPPTPCLTITTTKASSIGPAMLNFLLLTPSCRPIPSRPIPPFSLPSSYPSYIIFISIIIDSLCRALSRLPSLRYKLLFFSVGYLFYSLLFIPPS